MSVRVEGAAGIAGRPSVSRSACTTACSVRASGGGSCHCVAGEGGWKAAGQTCQLQEHCVGERRKRKQAQVQGTSHAQTRLAFSAVLAATASIEPSWVYLVVAVTTPRRGRLEQRCWREQRLVRSRTRSWLPSNHSTVKISCKETRADQCQASKSNLSLRASVGSSTRSCRQKKLFLLW